MAPGVKNLTCQCSRCKKGGFHPWVGNLLHYSCLENPGERGCSWATAHKVKSQHDGSDLACTHTKPAVKNPPDTFSISSHKDNAEWYTTKVITNISLTSSTARQKNENIKLRHYFANNGLSCQSYGFSYSHIWM